jgi:hypothetical protein
MQHRILEYYRYVTDNLIIYSTEIMCMGNMLEKFRSSHHSLVSTREIKNNNPVSVLDITIHETSTLW